MGDQVRFLGWTGTAQRVCDGDEYIVYNFTEATSSNPILDIQRGGRSFFKLRNDTGVVVGYSDAGYLETGVPFLDVLGYADSGHSAIRIYDSSIGDSALAINLLSAGTLGKITEFVLGVPSGATADGVGVRFSYNAETATPLGKVASFGHTGAGPGYLYTEVVNITPDGSVHITKRGGSILWEEDGDGSIGTYTSYRPKDIFAATSIVANVVEAGNASSRINNSKLTNYSLVLSGNDPGTNNKTIVAYDGTGAPPTIQYDETTNRWQFKVGGGSFADFGSANTWDDIYANGKTLDINDNAGLTFSQSSSQGGFLVSRALATAASTAPVLSVLSNPTSGNDYQPALSARVHHNGGILSDKIEGLYIEAKANAAATSGEVIGCSITVEGYVGEDAQTTYYGLRLSKSGSGALASIGASIQSGFSYGLDSASRGRFNFQTSDTVSGVVPQHGLNAHVTAPSGGFSASANVSGLYASYATNALDTAGRYSGVHVGFTNNGGAAEKRGITVIEGFDYGIYSESKTIVAVSPPASTSTNASSSHLSGVSGTGAYVCTDSQLVSSGISMGSCTGFRSIFQTLLSDNEATYIGFAAATFLATGTNTTSHGVSVGGGWTNGVRSLSRGYFEETISGQGGTGTSWVFESKAQAAGAGLPDQDRVAAFKATIQDSVNDAGPYYYGFYATTTDNGTISINNKYAFYVDEDWQTDGYSFRSESGVQRFSANRGSTGSFTQTLIQTLATIQTTSATGTLLRLEAWPTSADTDGTSWTGIDLFKSSKHDKVSTAINISGGSNYWNYGLYARDCHAVYATANLSLHSSFLNYGIINIATNNTSPILGASFYYAGVKISHTFNASDTNGALYGIHIQPGTKAGNSLYYGCFIDSQCDIGLGVSGVKNAVFVSSGRVFSSSSTANYVTSGAQEDALLTAKYTSNMLISGNHYNVSSTYARHASDTSGASIFCYIANAINGVGSAVTYGYRAQSTLDWGFDSYAARNSFIRSNGITTTADPVVRVINQDIDVSGGGAAALLVQNGYSATTSKCLEINHAYSSTTEGTRRAIVLNAVRRNRRYIPMSLGQPDETGSSIDFYYYGAISTEYWSTYTTANARYITFPLTLPHRSWFVRAYLYQYCATTATGTSLPFIGFYRRSGSGNAIQVQDSYASGSGSVGISLTMSTTQAIINNQYQYFIRYRNCTTGASAASIVYYLYVDYDIDDLSAPCGW